MSYREGVGGEAGQLGLLAVLVVGIASMLVSRGVDPNDMVVIGGAVVGALVLMCVPVYWLPSLAVVVLGFFPTGLLPSSGIFNILPPISLIMVVWVIRRILFGQGSPGRGVAATPAPVVRNAVGRYLISVCVGLFVAWCCWRILSSPAPQTGLGWLIAFTIGALLPLLVFDARAESRLLRRVVLIVGGCVGAYAVVELILGSSPVYATIYNVLGEPYGEKQWSVYRARAAFAHPLFAGSFLVIPAALGIGSWLAGGRTRDGILGFVAAIGLVATVSRGSILAIGGAVIFALIVAVFTPGLRNGKRVVILAACAALGAFALAFFPPLQQRTSSAESELSTEARDVGIYIALRAAESWDWLGAGPGTSGIVSRQFSMVVIENSFLQLLISVGVPGLILFCLILAIACFLALSARDIGAAAALVGYAIAVAGFNSLDALRLLHVIIGLLLLLCLNPANPASEVAAPSRSRTRVEPARSRPQTGRRAVLEGADG